jgi:hypothetical protein
MTLAVPARVFSFDEFARQKHRHFPGDRLDAQFAAHQDAISEIHNFLAKAFRSDGQLLNGAITPETLAPDLVAEITRNLRQEFKSDLEKAHAAAEQARIDAENARNDLRELQILVQQAVLASQQVNGSAGSAISELKALEIRAQVASEVLAARQANVMSLQATVLAGAGSSEEWSVASMQWAEHMGGPLPAETIAWMGITGEHWSSRWWANQASIIVSEITDAAEDAVEAVDEFHDLYLGAHPLPPTLDNDGDPLVPGAMYFNTADNTMYVWTGTAWQGMTGDVGITAAQNLGTGQVVYAGTTVGVLQFNTIRATGLSAASLNANTISVDTRFPTYDEVTGKPPTYPATAHVHSIAEVTNLQPTLDAKVDLGGDTMTGALQVPAGTATAPSLAIAAANNGIYGSAGNLNFSTSGVARVLLSTTALTTTLPVRALDGTAAAPAYSFNSNTNLGLWRAGADTLGFATAGTNRLSISSTLVSSALPVALPADPASDLHAATKAYVDAAATAAAVASAGKVSKTGDTMSGDLTLASSTPEIYLSKTSGAGYGVLYGRLNSNPRWEMHLIDSTAEAGADSGSNFKIARFSDAGALLDTPFGIDRATGVVSFTKTPLVAGSPLIGGVTISDTPPSSPVPGQLWLESDSGALFARWDDGSGSPSVQWVQVNPSMDTSGLVLKAGDTMTGDLAISNADPAITLSSTPGTAANGSIYFQRGTSTRWGIITSVPESSGNAGSDLYFQASNDSGAFLQNSLVIRRSDGRASFAGPVVATVAGTGVHAISGNSADGHGVYGNTTNSAYCGVVGYNYDNSCIARLGYNTYAAYLTGNLGIASGTLNINSAASSNMLSLVNGANSLSIGYAGSPGGYNVLPSSQRHTFYFAGTATYNMDQGYFFCSPSGATTLGTGTYRWGQIYSTVGTISTSDERLKQDIRPLDEAERRVALALKGLIVAYRYKEAVTAKGDEARIHTGVIAQRVAEAFAAEGLDAARYGLWCADEQYTENYVEDVPTDVEEIDEETGEARTVTKMAGRYEKILTGETIYSIRYEELLAFIIGGL